MNPLMDQPQTRHTYDSQNMMGIVESFHSQCVEAEQNARKFSLPKIPSLQNNIIAGMGGSAIGGDLLRAYATSRVSIPIEVIRNYSLPNYVNSNTLVIASSYSGNTEETLSAYHEAKQRDAFIIGMATGGELASLCEKDGYPCLKIPTGIQPRAALGYSMVSLLVLLEQLNVLDDQREALKSMFDAIHQCCEENKFEVPEERNPAKQLAKTLEGKIPVIYAGQDAFEPVAIRWRSQLNENAKTLAHMHVLPEMNHNEILGWSHPKSVFDQFHVICLLDSGYSISTRKRFEITERILRQHGIGVSQLESTGKHLLARMMSLVHLADYVSVYLAFLYEQDPTPIPAIEQLKFELKQ